MVEQERHGQSCGVAHWCSVFLGGFLAQLRWNLPHRRLVAGTPHCSPVALGHTVAPASSLSKMWAPGQRTPAEWVCQAHPQPHGSLDIEDHSQFKTVHESQSTPCLPVQPQLHAILSCVGLRVP